MALSIIAHFSRVTLSETTGRRIRITVFEAEKDANNVDPRPEIRKCAKECWNLICGNENALQALQKLLDAGCDWVQVLWCVNGFCEHYELPAKLLNVGRTKAFHPLSKRISKFEQKLARWETEIHKFNREITEKTHVDLVPHAPDFEAYRAVLSVAQKAALPSSWKRSSKEENAAYLYHLVKESTGDPHFEEIADLIDARLQYSDAIAIRYEHIRESPLFRSDTPVRFHKKDTIDAVELNKIVRSFKEKDPKRFQSLLKGVKFALKHVPAAWRRMPAVVQTQN